MDVYSRIEKTREVIKTALKIEEMPPDKLNRKKKRARKQRKNK